MHFLYLESRKLHFIVSRGLQNAFCCMRGLVNAIFSIGDIENSFYAVLLYQGSILWYTGIFLELGSNFGHLVYRVHIFVIFMLHWGLSNFGHLCIGGGKY